MAARFDRSVNRKIIIVHDGIDLQSATYLHAGAALPATCEVGQLFFLTTATAGENLHVCHAKDTWTQITGSGGGGGGAPSMFSTTGIGSWWPFGWPDSAGAVDSPNPISGGVANRVQYFEFSLPAGATIRKAVVSQGTVHDAGKVFAVGIYDSTGAKLGETGTGTSAANVTAGLTFTTPAVLTAGTYYLAISSDSTTIKLAAGTAGAPHGNLTAWIGTNDTPRLFYGANTANFAAAAGSRLPATIGSKTANSFNTPPMLVLIP